MNNPPPVPMNDSEETNMLSVSDEPKQFQPDGEGYNLYFPKHQSKRFNIDSETPVQETFVVRDGKVEWFGNAQFNAGFSKDELRRHAEERGWETTDEYDGGRWSYTFKEPEYGTLISIDEPSIVDGRPLNNVFVKSCEITLESNLKVYNILKSVANEQNLDVTIRDTEGIWQRLKHSSTIESPDPEVLTQLVRKANAVKAHLNFAHPSLWMTLEELDVLVETINEGMQAVPDENIAEDSPETTEIDISA